MTESAEAPRADEPQPAEAGDTSGEGAPQSVSRGKSPFDKGFGSGITKGRKEGASAREAEILTTLGFESLDQLREVIESRQSEEENRARQVQAEMARMKREIQARDKQLAQLAARADQARLDRLRAKALEHGVGRGRQLDAFVAMHQDQVQWGDDHTLEVVRRDGANVVPTGQTLDEWITAALEDAPFLTEPRGTSGGGSRVEPATGPDPTPTDLFDILGVKRG